VQVREAIDKSAEQSEAKRNQAFDDALANINSSYNEVADQLKQSRKRMEADALDFDLFQESLAKDRQAGLWFKSLYADPDVAKRLRDRREANLDVRHAAALLLQTRRQLASLCVCSRPRPCLLPI
jgi:hypothetical protein